MRSAKKFCTDLWQMLMQKFRPTSSTNTVIPKCFVGSEKTHPFCLGLNIQWISQKMIVRLVTC